VTQGVSFADGELERDWPVRVVTENGDPIPTQSRCLATWNRDMRFVKWLLVDFQVDLESEEERSLFLEYGPDAAAPEPPVALQVEEVPDAKVDVDTGMLRMHLRGAAPAKQTHRPPAAFVGFEVKTQDGWEEVQGEGAGLRLYMKDQHGHVYDSCSAGHRTRVTVEEAGPMRACICVKGYHSAPNGPMFCPYILRLHFFAGKPDIRVFHTFVFDQEPHDVQLGAIGMNVGLDLGRLAGAAVGGEGVVVYEAVPGQSIRLLQSSDRLYEVFSGAEEKGSGSRSAGWARYQGARGAAVAVIRDHWQEYPKGFSVTEDGLDIRIWPEEHHEPLSFTSPFEEEAVHFNGTRDEEEVKRLLAERPTAPLNLKSFFPAGHDVFLWVEKMMEKHAVGRTMSYNDTGTRNGIGAAKTTEIRLRLRAGTISDGEAQELAAAVQAPLIAPPEPAYTCATGALGHAYHAGDPRFAEMDAGLDDIMKLVAFEPIERCRLYGMMRYGNLVCSHSAFATLPYVHYKDTEPEKALRYVGPYNNEANDQIGAVWGHFVRSGRRDYFLLAQRYSRNVADVGIIHSHPSAPDRVGLMHYHNAHQWSGGGSPSHTLVRGLLIDYFFTGNRRLLDGAGEVGDRLVRLQEPCGILSCRGGALHREFTGPLWNLLELYQTTWEAKYGELARRSLNWFLRTLPEPGSYRVSVFTRGDHGDEAVVEPPIGCAGQARDIVYLLEIALRLFDSQTLRDHVLAEADHYVWDLPTENYFTAEMARKVLTPASLLWPVDNRFYWSQNVTSALPDWQAAMACLAYDLTGDMTYAAFAKEMLFGSFLRRAQRVRRFATFRFTWVCFGSFIPALMRTVAEAMCNDPDALAEAERTWKEKRAGKGMPIYDGPGIDLDKDTMDANGNILNRPPVELPREGPGRRRKPLTNLGRLSTEDHPPPASGGKLIR